MPNNIGRLKAVYLSKKNQKRQGKHLGSRRNSLLNNSSSKSPAKKSQPSQLKFKEAYSLSPTSKKDLFDELENLNYKNTKALSGLVNLHSRLIELDLSKALNSNSPYHFDEKFSLNLENHMGSLFEKYRVPQIPEIKETH